MRGLSESRVSPYIPSTNRKTDQMKLRFSHLQSGIYPDQMLHWNPEVIEGNGTKRYERYLCGVLSTIAEIPEDCDRFLKYIEDIENGIETEIETGANDVALTFRPTGVQVDILINDDWCDQPEGHFELREWKVALAGWRRILSMPRSLDSVVEVTL